LIVVLVRVAVDVPTFMTPMLGPPAPPPPVPPTPPSPPVPPRPPLPAVIVLDSVVIAELNR
jgi:hypothetical protein